MWRGFTLIMWEKVYPHQPASGKARVRMPVDGYEVAKLPQLLIGGVGRGGCDGVIDVIRVVFSVDTAVFTQAADTALIHVIKYHIETPIPHCMHPPWWQEFCTLHILAPITQHKSVRRWRCRRGQGRG